MAEFVLTCCSTADMPKEYFEKREIPYACFHYEMDGKQYLDDLGVSMSFTDFYQRIKDGAMPITSQVNEEEFTALWEPILKQGGDILHVTLSSGLSGEINSANIAREELKEKYPGRKLEIVDSLGASSGYGLLVDTLADMRDRGVGLEETRKWAEDNKLKVHHWFFSTDLTHFKRGGRISAVSATMGTMLSICPLMNMSYDGKLIPRYKIRSKQKVIKAIVGKMEEHVQNGKDYSGKCFISNSACYEDARQVADLVEANFPKLDGKVMINSVGTVIGSHTGPGTVALFFFGDERVD